MSIVYWIKCAEVGTHGLLFLCLLVLCNVHTKHTSNEFRFSEFSLRNQFFFFLKKRQWNREQIPNCSAKSFTYQKKREKKTREYMLVECKTPKIEMEWINVDHRITPKTVQMKFCLDTGHHTHFMQLNNAFGANKQAWACMYGVYLFNRNWIFTHHLILQCFFFFYTDFESTFRFPHIFIFTHISIHTFRDWLQSNPGFSF